MTRPGKADAEAVPDLEPKLAKQSYRGREDCILPSLIDGETVLPTGQTYQCAHRVWTVQWLAVHGGRPQPVWAAS